MIESSVLLAIFFFAMISTFSPGPNNFMLLSSGLNYGARKTLPHALGIILGCPILVFSVGMGLSHVFEYYPIVHSLLKIISIIYLLFLSWKIAATETNTSLNSSTKPMTFVQALAFQWVNPKAWVMALGAISTFTVIEKSMLVQVLVISFAFFVVAIFSTSIWTYCGVVLKKVLAKPPHRRAFNIAMGILLVLAVLPMIDI
jgi:threonine/homoserine/homoserine lactone efflux protein